MDTTRIKSIRAGNRAAVTKFFKKLEELNLELDIEVAGPIIDAIEKKQNVILKLDEQILEKTPEEEIEHEISEADEYNLELETNLRRVKKLIKTSSETCNEHTPVSYHTTTEFVPTVSQTSSISSQNHRLPKLSLPTFAGDILEWPYFWDSFETTIHNNHTLTDVQKFSYLQSLLESEAMNVINGLNLSSANYHKAIDLLINRYGQKHKIVNAYMKALLDLPAPLETLESLRNFSDKSEAYIRGLESLGQCQDMYGSLLIPVILGKLPVAVKSNITRENGNDDWTLDNLRIAIQKEIAIKESSQGDLPQNVLPTASFHTGVKSNTKNGHNASYQRVNRNNAGTKTQTKSCIFCQESHYPAECTKVADISSRWEMIKKKKLCFNCFGNHKISECHSKHNCRKCQRRHHTSLCNGSPVQPKENLNATNSAPDLHASAVQQNSTVFLKTAVAPVWSQTQSNDAYILFDEGAQRSFITQNLANKLNVQPEGTETLNVAAFGDSSKTIRNLNRTTVYLEADFGDKIPLSVLIVPTIATPLQNQRRYVSQKLEYLRGLKLAHPLTENDSFEISLLIGADHYWHVVKDEIVRGNGPTAMNSKIGYLLSGPLNTNSRQKTPQFMMHILANHTEEEQD